METYFFKKTLKSLVFLLVFIFEGEICFGQQLQINGDSLVTGNATVNGNELVKGGLSVLGPITLSNDISVSGGTSTLSISNISSTGASTLGSTNVTGVANFIGETHNSANSYFQHEPRLASSGNGVGMLRGFKNKIINGDFSLWNRGTSIQLTSSAYVADRWYAGSSQPSDTQEISRVLFDAGQTSVPGEPVYYLHWDKTVDAQGGSAPELLQAIEGVDNFAGQTVVYSFWAKFNQNTVIVPRAIQNFGSGGSPLVLTTCNTTPTILQTWAYYTITCNVPSISGKTIGSGNYFAFDFYWVSGASSAFTLDITQVQVESGSVATSFEKRPIGLDLLLAQRYFWKLGSGEKYSPFGSGYVNTASTCRILFHPPVEMRKTPTLTSSSPSSLRATHSNGATVVTGITLPPNESGNVVMQAEITSSGMTIGSGCFLQGYNNDQAYVAFDAEFY